MNNKLKISFIIIGLVGLLIFLGLFMSKFTEMDKNKNNSYPKESGKTKEIIKKEKNLPTKIDRTKNGKLKVVNENEATKEDLKKVLGLDKTSDKKLKKKEKAVDPLNSPSDSPKGKAQFKNIPKYKNGVEYNSFFYKEPVVEGKEPKWNFTKIYVQPRKLGDSTVVYSRCSKCHGRLGKKKAFGESAPLKYMPSNLIFERLKAYRDSNLNLYGHGKLMQTMVKDMNDKDFYNLINQIKGLTEKVYSENLE